MRLDAPHTMNNPVNSDAQATTQADDVALDQQVSGVAPDSDDSCQKPSGETVAKGNAVAAEGAEGDRIRQEKPRKLYQALARVAGTLKSKGNELVIVTEPDQAELVVVNVVGKNTAMRLLKLADGRRRGTFSLYPEMNGFKVVTFLAEASDRYDTDAPPNDQMFISGKLASVEADAFYIDVDRNKRTIKAKRLVKMPLKIEGHSARSSWKVGQWLGLTLHREGTRWVWRGDTKEVLKAARQRNNKQQTN